MLHLEPADAPCVRAFCRELCTLLKVIPLNSFLQPPDGLLVAPSESL